MARSNRSTRDQTDAGGRDRRHETGPTSAVRLRPWFLALIATGLLAITACGTPGGAAGASEVSGPTPVCEIGDSQRATSGRQILRTRGIAATYTQVLPADYDGSTAVPLVIGFGTDLFDREVLSATSPEPIVIHADPPRPAGTWRGSANDLQLVEDILLRAETEVCHDTSQIFVYGEGTGQDTAVLVARLLDGRVTLLGPEQAV